MSRYLVRRLLISIPVLAGISLILFSVLALAPGDPFEELATNPNVPAEVAQRLREQFGRHDPGLGPTLWVLGSAQVLGILVAFPIGVSSALRPYSLFDQFATTFAFIGFSLPTFFTGLVFLLFFSIQLDLLPFICRADLDSTGLTWVWDSVKQALMPVTVLGLFQGASLTRFVRSAVLDVVRLDYVNTARSKGLSERVTIVKHVVRNALIPVVTLVALPIPGIFTGAVVTEQVFPVPGFRRPRRAGAGAVVLLGMVAAVLTGPWLWRVPINEIDFKAKLQGTSLAHPLGTDDLGQDLLARVLYGGGGARAA